MKTLTTRLAVMAAAISMVFTPIAAQANTRAGDTVAVYSAQSTSQPWIIGDDDEGGWLFGDNAILAALIALAAVGGLIIVLDDSNNQSPGAN